jgi:putative SOS response-associated peptidase YedK
MTMLTNYSIASEKSVLQKKFALEEMESFEKNFNAQPTQALPVITNKQPDQAMSYFWGITGGFTKNKSVSQKWLYAPAEQLGTKATLKNGLMQRRCAILADGFYTWKSIAKKEAIPYRSCLKDNEPFAMAGIWNQYTDESDQIYQTFMLITTQTQGSLSEYTDQAPLILHEELLVEWLNPATQDDSLLDYLGSCHHRDFISYSINPRLADPTFNQAKLWEKVPPANQFGNLTLFS